MIRWTLAERFHWTLAEVDALTLTDLSELYSIDDGRGKANDEQRQIAEHKRRIKGKG